MGTKFLQVVTKLAGDNRSVIAITANGISLGSNEGCLISLFSGARFPFAPAYFDYLANQGWRLVSSTPMNIFQTLHTFEGIGGDFEIEWRDGNWYPINSYNRSRQEYLDDY